VKRSVAEPQELQTQGPQPAERAWLNNFMDQLDQAGEQGYKLISATYRWQGSYAAPVAILERDEAQREYAWF